MGDWKQRSTNDPPPKRNKPAKKRADFRKKKKDPLGGQPEGGSKSYTQRDGRKSGQQKFWHRVRVATLTLSSLALVAALGGFLIYQLTRRATPLLVLGVDEYAAPLAPNAFAKEDAQRMEDFFGHQSEGKTLIAVKRAGHEEKTFAERLTSSLEDFLEENRPGGPNNDVVMIYLSAHGVVNKNNQACLLPKEADALDDETWLPVSEVLRTIRDKSAALAPGTKILLILDAGRIHTDWSLGILYNGFADRLKYAVTSADIKNLYVLNSTSEGQTAWTDPRHARSIFGYYVAEGLRGGADDADRGGSGDGLGDDEISLKELHEFVRSHVAGWVKKNRSSDQVPMLIQGDDDQDDDDQGNGDQGNGDFILAAADSDYREDLSVEENLDEQESEIETLWNDRGKLTKQKVHERDPVNWAKLEHMLLRLERLSLAGDAYRQQFVHTKEDARRLLDEMKLSVPIHNRPVFSIPLAEQRGPLTDDDTKRYMSEARRRWQSAQQAQGIRELSADVAGSSAGKRPHFVEIQFLEMLAQQIEWVKYEQGAKTELRDDTQEAVLLAVKARHSAERAAAPPDQRAHYWIQSEVDEADATRRRAEDWLYVGSETKINDAHGALKTLLDETYPQAALRSKQVADAYDLRDEAWRDAPYLAQRMLAHAYRMLVVPDDEAALSGVDEAEMKNEMRKEMKAVGGLLLEMIGEAHRLGEKLDADRVAAELPDSKRLGDALTALRERYDPYIDSYSHGRRKVGFTTMRDELHSPRFLSDDRSELRSNLRKKYREALFGQDSLHRLSDPTPADDVEYLRLLVELRVHPALAILDRQWALKMPAADDDKRSLAGKPADRQALLKQLAEMGGQVRSSLRHVWDEPAQRKSQEQVDKNLRKLEELDAAAGPRERSRAIRRPLAAADHRLRAAMPIHPWKQTDDHPTALLRSVDLHFQYHWHAQRILEDFWGKSNARAAQNFFAAASRGYLDSARRLPGLPWHDERDAAVLKKKIELLGKAKFSISGMLDASRKPTDLKKGEPYRLKPSVEFGVQIRESDGKQLEGEAAISFADQNKEALTVNYGQRLATRIPASLNSETEEFSIKELPPSLTAALWYRGHRCETPIPLASPPLPPRVIAVDHPDRSKTKVTIVSDRPPRVYLAIVLDCSRSMEDDAKLGPFVAAPDKDVAWIADPKFPKSRYNHVANGLMDVLKELPKENYYINLWLFGHRVGLKVNDDFGKVGESMYVVVPANPPMGITPAKDVENVLKGFRPAGRAMKDIKKKLNGLKRKFHGITPLYWSMSKALEGLEREKIGSQDSRQLIVITDGADTQKDKDGPIPPRRRFTANDLATVAAEYFAKDGRLDVYGINLGDGLDKLEKAINDKRHFKLHGKGAAAAAAIPALKGNLQKLIRSPEFRVIRKNKAKTVKTGWRPLSDKTFDVKDLGGGLENCQEDKVPKKETLLVEVRGIKHPPKPLPIRLYGGENVKLSLKYDYKIKRYVLKHVSSKSVRRPGKTKQPRPENVTGSLREYYIIRHDPEIVASDAQVNISQSRDVIFRFSVRNKRDEDDKDSGKFVPRPRFVLAKITPVAPNAPPGTNTHEYHFYEPVFDSSYSFPCFTFRAKNWPGRSGPGIAAANIELWYVIGDVDSDFTDLVPRKVNRETPKRLTYFMDLDLTIKFERFGGDNKWKVTEEYGPNAKDHLFSVVLESNPPTDYTKRTYYPEKDKMLVSHEFHYQPSDIPCILVRKKSDVKKVAGWRKWSDIKIALPR